MVSMAEYQDENVEPKQIRQQMLHSTPFRDRCPLPSPWMSGQPSSAAFELIELTGDMSDMRDMRDVRDVWMSRDAEIQLTIACVSVALLILHKVRTYPLRVSTGVGIPCRFRLSHVCLSTR